MAFSLRYGEPDWDAPPRQRPGFGSASEILQRPLSDKSYEELRLEATQKQWANKFLDLNSTAVSSGAATTFVNLKNLTDVVEVVVGQGDEQARWVIHQKLLTDSSEFAALALKNNFKEKEERVIRFPEESSEVFAHFVRFLYTGCVLTFSLELVVQMYTLGDRLQSIKFANACYETIARSTDSYSPDQIRYVFDNTYSEDRLRKLCTSQVGKGVLQGRYSFSAPHEKELLHDLMPDLMQGVTAAVAEMRKGADKWYPTQTTTHSSAVEMNHESPFRRSEPSGAFGLFGNPFAAPSSTTTSESGTFGAPSHSIASTSSPFGPLQGTSTGHSVFGSQPNNSTPGAASSNLFRPTFGNTASSAATSGGLFGNQASSHGGGSLFGTRPSASAGGLFGQSNNTPSTSGGLFGNPTQTMTGGLFGNPTQSVTGGLFSNPTQSVTGGLFGNPTQSETGDLRGNPPPTVAHGAGGPFGNPSNTSSSDGLFSNVSSAQPSGGLFGSARPSTEGLFGVNRSNLFGNPALAQSNDSAFGQAPRRPKSAGGNLFGNRFHNYDVGNGDRESANAFSALPIDPVPQPNASNTTSSLFSNPGFPVNPALPPSTTTTAASNIATSSLFSNTSTNSPFTSYGGFRPFGFATTSQQQQQGSSAASLAPPPSQSQQQPISGFSYSSGGAEDKPKTQNEVAQNTTTSSSSTAPTTAAGASNEHFKRFNFGSPFPISGRQPAENSLSSRLVGTGTGTLGHTVQGQKVKNEDRIDNDALTAHALNFARDQGATTPEMRELLKNLSLHEGGVATEAGRGADDAGVGESQGKGKEKVRNGRSGGGELLTPMSEVEVDVGNEAGMRAGGGGANAKNRGQEQTAHDAADVEASTSNSSTVHISGARETTATDDVEAAKKTLSAFGARIL